MRTHSLSKKIATPKSLDGLKAIKNPDGEMFVEYGSKNYEGVIFGSAELTALSEEFKYASDGYDELVEVNDRQERSISANIIGGVLGNLSELTLNMDFGDVELNDLSPDLRPYEEKWTSLFNKFVNVISPVMGASYEMRLKVCHYATEFMHHDNMVVGILPLGEFRASTVICSNNKLIRPKENRLVMTTPELLHSSPISLMPRACLMAIKCPSDF